MGASDEMFMDWANRVRTEASRDPLREAFLEEGRGRFFIAADDYEARYQAWLRSPQGEKAKRRILAVDDFGTNPENWA